MSPALAGGFLTTVPPGKSQQEDFLFFFSEVVNGQEFEKTGEMDKYLVFKFVYKTVLSIMVASSHV